MKNTLITNKLLISGALMLGLSATEVMAERQYAIEGLLGKADQKNSIAGAQVIDGFESSQGIRFVAPLGRVTSLELGYMDFGKVEDRFIDSFGDTITDTLETESFNVGMRAELPLGRIVSLTGRVGLAFWDFNFTETDSAFPGDVFRSDDEGVDTYVGFGMQFDIEDDFRVAIEYTFLEFDADFDGLSTDQDIKNVAFSVGYRF